MKDASDKKILVDMLLWAIDNAAPANFMLISGDRDFSNALHQLRMRRYNILLAQPPQASVPLVAAAKNVWLWTSLASGDPPLTSYESSQLFNNVRCHHVTNKDVSKHSVSEQVQSSKPTDSSSDPGDTKDHKTREKHVRRGLRQEARRNMLKNSSGTTSESSRLVNNGHCHVSNYEVSKYPVSEQAQSRKPTDSTSDAGDTKDHRTREAMLVEHVEAMLVEPVVCKVCQISCTNNDTYTKHTYGKRHRNNLELLSGKSKNISVGPVEPSKEVLEKHKKNKKAIEGRAKAKSDLACRMCNVVCQRQSVFDSHLRGQKHANMLSQSEASF